MRTAVAEEVVRLRTEAAEELRSAREEAAATLRTAQAEAEELRSRARTPRRRACRGHRAAWAPGPDHR